jgi:hypothetical protein
MQPARNHGLGKLASIPPAFCRRSGHYTRLSPFRPQNPRELGALAPHGQKEFLAMTETDPDRATETGSTMITRALGIANREPPTPPTASQTLM